MRNKIALTALLCLAIVIMQAFTQDPPAEKKKHEESNLKILPKNISEEQLHLIMKEYSKALGVRCSFCHKLIDDKHLDFASDDKKEKITTRKMMKMTAAINKKYLDKMSNHYFEHITCVSCHMGSTKPTVSVDSLAKGRN